MKRVVSISLGSSKRDKKVTATFFGEDFEISRVGTDGDLKTYRRKIEELDGTVDAFGVGGTDLYFYAGGRRYASRETLQLWSAAKKTPYVDGSGLKHTLERETVTYLQEKGIVDFTRKDVLVVCAVDRFGMAEALSERARSIVFGDMMFNLGINKPIRSLATAQRLARLLLPVITQLPISWFYPMGEKQEQVTPKYPRYFAEADVIAGDFLLIRRFMPRDLAGKIIFTNTTTEEDVAALKERGVYQLITTTPVFDGRSFGTNVMEAVLVALLGKKPEEISPEEYLVKLQELGWTPRVQELNQAVESPQVVAAV